MSAANITWRLDEMATEIDGDIKAVLRTLRLAKAQLQILKKHFANDPAKSSEIADMEIALEMIIKKVSSTSAP